MYLSNSFKKADINEYKRLLTESFTNYKPETEEVLNRVKYENGVEFWFNTRFDPEEILRQTVVQYKEHFYEPFVPEDHDWKYDKLNLWDTKNRPLNGHKYFLFDTREITVLFTSTGHLPYGIGYTTRHEVNQNNKRIFKIYKDKSFYEEKYILLPKAERLTSSSLIPMACEQMLVDFKQDKNGTAILHGIKFQPFDCDLAFRHHMYTLNPSTITFNADGTVKGKPLLEKYIKEEQCSYTIRKLGFSFVNCHPYKI